MAKPKGVRTIISRAKTSLKFSRKYQGLNSGNNAVKATGGRPTRKGR